MWFDRVFFLFCFCCQYYSFSCFRSFALHPYHTIISWHIFESAGVTFLRKFVRHSGVQFCIPIAAKTHLMFFVEKFARVTCMLDFVFNPNNKYCFIYYSLRRVVLMNGGQTFKGRQLQAIQKGVKAGIGDPRILCTLLSKFLDPPLLMYTQYI